MLQTSSQVSMQNLNKGSSFQNEKKASLQNQRLRESESHRLTRVQVHYLVIIDNMKRFSQVIHKSFTVNIVF